MMEKGDFSDFEHGMVDDARQAGLVLPLYWDFHAQPSLCLTEQQFCSQKCLVDVRGLRVGRLL